MTCDQVQVRLMDAGPTEEPKRTDGTMIPQPESQTGFEDPLPAKEKKQSSSEKCPVEQLSPITPSQLDIPPLPVLRHSSQEKDT